MTGKVDTDELDILSGYAKPISGTSQMSPMHSVEGPEGGEVRVSTSRGSSTERLRAPEATIGLRRGGVLGFSTSLTIQPCKGYNGIPPGIPMGPRDPQSPMETLTPGAL